MAKKIFEIDFHKGSIIDTVSNTPLTIRGSMPLKMKEKGLSAFTISNANNYNFIKTLAGQYSLVAFVNSSLLNSISSVFDFRTSSGTGYLQIATAGVIQSASGSTYVNGSPSTNYTKNKFSCIILSGTTINSTLINIFNSYIFGNSLNGLCSYIAIYEGTLTQNEINGIQDDFLAQKPLSQPTNLQTTRSVVNFDLNTYITIPDNDSLDFGTVSFSIAWEDTYPQRQSATWGGIISKGQNTSVQANSFGIFHNGTSVNGLRYLDSVTAGSLVGGNSLTLISNISNGNHKFLLVRDSAQTKILLYIDNALVYTSGVINIADVTNTSSLSLKASAISLSKSSGSLKNVKMWKGQVVTPSQVNTYKTGLVLDSPLNEGQGTIVYDKTGVNNGSIITTAGYTTWKKQSFKLDKKVIDWKFDRADETNIVPKGFIKGIGNYKLVTTTTEQGNYGGIKKGENYLECTTSGNIVLPSNWANGTIEFDFYKGADANAINIGFISNSIAQYNTATNPSYWFFIQSNEVIALVRDSTLSQIFRTNTSYISNQTWYRVKINRDITGKFTLYIKGGDFGSSYILMSATGGAGTNPVTDNTHTISNFMMFDLDSGDRLGKIITSPLIY